MSGLPAVRRSSQPYEAAKTTMRTGRDGSERVMLGEVILKEKPARKRAKRHEWKFSCEMLRLREVEQVISNRHGGMIPDPEDTDDRETCLAYIKAAAFSLTNQCMFNWCLKWAPWARDDEIAIIISAAKRRRRMMTANGVAGLIHVTWEQRRRLKLKTIGAYDLTEEQRAEKARECKRERDRNKKAEARRVNGCKARASYEAQSLSSTEPWKAEGISRATWYRHRETSVSQIDIPLKDDGLVSLPKSKTVVSYAPTAPLCPQLNTGRVTARQGSPETEFLAEVQEAAPHGRSDSISEDAA